MAVSETGSWQWSDLTTTIQFSTEMKLFFVPPHRVEVVRLLLSVIWCQV